MAPRVSLFVLFGPSHSAEGFVVQGGHMEFIVRRVTYDKLERSLNALSAEGWVPWAPVYVGGRDWVLVLQR